MTQEEYSNNVDRIHHYQELCAKIDELERQLEGLNTFGARSFLTVGNVAVINVSAVGLCLMLDIAQKDIKAQIDELTKQRNAL